MNFFDKYKWWLLGAIVVIGLSIAFIVVYKKGKKWAPGKVDLPPDTQPGGATNFEPGPYTEAIWKDLDCVFCTHDSAPYEALMRLSNSQLVSIYNDWNARYFKKNNETLIQAIEADFTVWNSTWATTASNVITRLESLNLARTGRSLNK